MGNGSNHGIQDETEMRKETQARDTISIIHYSTEMQDRCQYGQQYTHMVNGDRKMKINIFMAMTRRHSAAPATIHLTLSVAATTVSPVPSVQEWTVC